MINNLEEKNLADMRKYMWSLYIPVITGDSETLNQLLKNGNLDINAKTVQGFTSMQLALDRGKFEVIKILIQAGADINSTSEKGFTALHFAIENKDDSMIEYLLSHGADVNPKIEGQTFLHRAVSEKREDLIVALLKNGADINAQNKTGNTPLHNSVDVETIRLFLKFKADVNIKNYHHENLLFTAAHSGNFEVMKLLIDLGLEVNCVNKNGSTPLHKAVRFSRSKNNNKNNIKKLAELLLKNGADVNAQDGRGNTALHNALENYPVNIELVKLLLDYKADVSIKNKQGKISLFNAINSQNMEVTQLLIDHGADVKLVANYSTLILKAAQYNNFDMAELLLKNGADVNAQDEDCRTSLHHLAIKDCQKIIRLFLSYKADVNIKNVYDETPLFDAVRQKNLEVVQLLLDHGSTVDCANIVGSTPLLEACKKICKIEILKCLLKHGANIEDLNSDQKTFSNYVQKNCQGDSGLRSLRFFFKYADISVINFGDNSASIDTAFLNNDNGFVTLSSPVLKHVAKLQMLNQPLNPSVLSSISNDDSLQKYYDECLEELAVAKSTKLKNSWITFFNLLVDNKRKLKNYAGNENLAEAFNNKIVLTENGLKFLIYGAGMKKNVEKGMKRRDLFHKSAKNNLKFLINRAEIKKNVEKGMKTRDLFDKSAENNLKFPIYGAEMKKNVEKGMKRRDLFDKSAEELSNCLPTLNPTHLIIRDILDCVSTKELSKFCEIV